MHCRKGQGALEYLLLIGGAVVVAVIVIFIMIGLANSTQNATNTTIQTGLQHIQGALDGGEEPPATGYCGDGIVDTESDPPEQCDCSGKTPPETPPCGYDCPDGLTAGSCSSNCELSGCE